MYIYMYIYIYIYIYIYTHTHRASLVAQRLKRLPGMQETQVQSLGQEAPLEKGMATHSSTLAWRIPWTEEPGRLQSMGLQRVGHDWATSLSYIYTPYWFFLWRALTQSCSQSTSDDWVQNSWTWALKKDTCSCENLTPAQPVPKTL